MKELRYIVIGMMFLLLALPLKQNKTTYETSAVVIEVRQNEQILEDMQGNIWSVDNDNLKLYARYILTIDTMETEEKTDDVILAIK